MTCDNTNKPTPPKPQIPTPIFDRIPCSMREWDHWVYWRYELTLRNEKPKWDKVLKSRPPVVEGLPGQRRPLGYASSTDPSTWTDFNDVMADIILLEEAAKAPGRVGVGYVIDDRDPFTVIDLDDCRDPDTGDITPAASAIISRFDSYAEVSPSGKGVKIFIRGKTADGSRTRTSRHPGIEIYSRKRFCTVTGLRLSGSPAEPQCRQAELEAFHAELFPEAPPAPTAPPSSPRQGSTSPNHPPTLPLRLPLGLLDHEVIDRARRARNGDRFERLWNGDASGQGGDRSAADFALAAHLAFWVGPDVSRIMSLMRQSGLARPKWDRPDYLLRTVERAVAGRVDYYTGERPHAEHRRRSCPQQAPPVPAKGGDGCTAIPCPPRDEAEAARRIAAARADQNCYFCPDCERQLLCHKDTGAPHVVARRCECWACDGCRAWFVFRYRENARLRFSQAKELHLVRCPEGGWPAARKRVERAGGNYYCVHRGEDTFAITDRPVSGSTPVSREAAFSMVCDAVDLLEAHPRDDDAKPVTTSRPWSIPKEERSGKFEHVCPLDPSLTPEKIREIAAACDLAAACCPPQDETATATVEWWSFGHLRFDGGRRRWAGTQEQFEALRDSLSAGEYVPPVEVDIGGCAGGAGGHSDAKASAL